jgi:cell division protein FtsW (lipid II flippase)
MRKLKTSRKNEAVWVADFCMCWIALCGLGSVATGIASFTFNIQLFLFGQPVTTPTQRLMHTGIYFAMSAFGFTYMLWRQNWRCRLSALLIIMTFWCAVLATTSALQADRMVQSWLSWLAIGGISIFMFLYALSWASRR